MIRTINTVVENSVYVLCPDCGVTSCKVAISATYTANDELAKIWNKRIYEESETNEN